MAKALDLFSYAPDAAQEEIAENKAMKRKTSKKPASDQGQRHDLSVFEYQGAAQKS